MRDLPKLVALTANGNTVDVEVWRNDRLKTIAVSVGTNDEPSVAESNQPQDASGNLGLVVAKVDSENAQHYRLEEDTVGVVIVEVLPDSSAAERGLREGDVIKRIDRTNVTSPDDVTRAIESSKSKNKESVLLLVERQSQSRFVVVPMKA